MRRTRPWGRGGATLAGLVLALGIGPTAAGCGYAIVRATPPAGIERIGVGTFVVRAGPPELGAWIAEAVATELAATPGVSLARAGGADAVVRGEVRLAGDAAVALASTGEAPRAAVAEAWLEVHAALIGRDGAALRAVGPLHPQALREVDATGAADQSRERHALRAVAAGAGRAIVRALFVD